MGRRHATADRYGSCDQAGEEAYGSCEEALEAYRSDEEAFEAYRSDEEALEACGSDEEALEACGPCDQTSQDEAVAHFLDQRFSDQCLSPDFLWLCWRFVFSLVLRRDDRELIWVRAQRFPVPVVRIYQASDHLASLEHRLSSNPIERVHSLPSLPRSTGLQFVLPLRLFPWKLIAFLQILQFLWDLSLLTAVVSPSPFLLRTSLIPLAQLLRSTRNLLGRPVVRSLVPEVHSPFVRWGPR